MIDRTTFELRIADHGTTTARINRRGWQRQSEWRTFRTTLADALVALAGRLAPERQPGERQGRAIQEHLVGA